MYLFVVVFFDAFENFLHNNNAFGFLTFPRRELICNCKFTKGAWKGLCNLIQIVGKVQVIHSNLLLLKCFFFIECTSGLQNVPKCKNLLIYLFSSY